MDKDKKSIDLYEEYDDFSTFKEDILSDEVREIIYDVLTDRYQYNVEMLGDKNNKNAFEIGISTQTKNIIVSEDLFLVIRKILQDKVKNKDIRFDIISKHDVDGLVLRFFKANSTKTGGIQWR